MPHNKKMPEYHKDLLEKAEQITKILDDLHSSLCDIKKPNKGELCDTLKNTQVLNGYIKAKSNTIDETLAALNTKKESIKLICKNILSNIKED